MTKNKDKHKNKKILKIKNLLMKRMVRAIFDEKINNLEDVY